VVNVHIHQFKPDGAVVDAAALAQFQEQWATYRKLITSNCLSHREVAGVLRDTLNEVFARPRGRLRAGVAGLRRSDRLLPLVPLRGRRRNARNGGDGELAAGRTINPVEC
jgi:hypothetical protein